jgi:hypothetical protein
MVTGLHQYDGSVIYELGSETNGSHLSPSFIEQRESILEISLLLSKDYGLQSYKGREKVDMNNKN